MKKGLYFGSFNPIHIWHLMIANYVLNHTDIDILSFVPSPNSPFKSEKELLDFNTRLMMINQAITDTENIGTDDIESAMPIPSYTYATINTIKERDKCNLSLIMGIDNWISFDRWKNYENIIREAEIIVIPRMINGIETLSKCQQAYRDKLAELEKNVSFPIVSKFLDEIPISELSSTFIRNEIKQGKCVKFYVADSTYEIIKKFKLYE